MGKPEPKRAAACLLVAALLAACGGGRTRYRVEQIRCDPLGCDATVKRLSDGARFTDTNAPQLFERGQLYELETSGAGRTYYAVLAKHNNLPRGQPMAQTACETSRCGWQ